jgi:hypothetical protein
MSGRLVERTVPPKGPLPTFALDGLVPFLAAGDDDADKDVVGAALISSATATERALGPPTIVSKK